MVWENLQSGENSLNKKSGLNKIYLKRECLSRGGGGRGGFKFWGGGQVELMVRHFGESMACNQIPLNARAVKSA